MELPLRSKNVLRAENRSEDVLISPVPSPRPIGQSNAEEGEGNDGGKQQVGRDIPAQPVRQQARETGEGRAPPAWSPGAAGPPRGIAPARPNHWTIQRDPWWQWDSPRAEDIDHAECRTLDKRPNSTADAQPAEPRQTAGRTPAADPVCGLPIEELAHGNHHPRAADHQRHRGRCKPLRGIQHG